MPLKVKVVTQEGILFEEDGVDQVNVPGSEGEMGILPHHAALLSTLAYGELRIRKGTAEESFIVYGGIVEVGPDHVTVLADVAQSSYVLDETQAQAARNRAEELMKTGAPDERNFALEEIHRATVQENILRKIKQRPASMRIKVVETDENNGHN